MTDINNFSDFKFYQWIVRQLNSIGIITPTPIQKHCIPPILSGKDCIGAAKTGSGKTLAFALPIIQKLSEDPYGIFALILTPTRELAFQIGDQFEIIGKTIGLTKCIIVGGVDMVAQGIELSKNPNIVVATPGRLVDHLESCNTFTLERIKFLVIDEADRLLGGHFDQQIKRIFKALPKERQSLFFSATITNTLHILKTKIKNEPFLWEAENNVQTVDTLKQYYLVCHPDAKDAYLVEAIRVYMEKHKQESILIFADTCKSCQLLSMMFNTVGFTNAPLHSMISQRERLASLTKFRSRHVRMLISTDVAARGLDIPGVGLVVNYSTPSNTDEYIHRVGRTARAGRPGAALTLLLLNEIKRLHAIENKIGSKLLEYPGVKDEEITKILLEVSVTIRKAQLTLDEKDFYKKRRINKRKQLIMEGKDPDEEEEKKEKERKKRRKEFRKQFKSDNKKQSNTDETSEVKKTETDEESKQLLTS